MRAPNHKPSASLASDERGAIMVIAVFMAVFSVGILYYAVGIRRPVVAVNAAVADWIHANVLNEEVVLETLRRLRLRLSERTYATNAELPNLERERTRLRTEIARLVKALALSDQAPQAVVEAIAERQADLAALEARLLAAEAAPEAISLEIRRLELEANKRIANLRGVLDSNPAEARKLMQSLFEGPLVCTPIETPDGPRFKIEGTAVVGNVLAGEFGALREPSGQRVQIATRLGDSFDSPSLDPSVSNVASPRGFEPLLQP